LLKTSFTWGLRMPARTATSGPRTGAPPSAARHPPRRPRC